MSSDFVSVEWTDGQVMDIAVIMCCQVPVVDGIAYGKLADGARVKLTTISFSKRGITLSVQKQAGNTSAQPRKRKAKSTAPTTINKKTKKNKNVTSDDVSGYI